MWLFDRIWLKSGGQKARENEREAQSFRVRAAKAENALFSFKRPIDFGGICPDGANLLPAPTKKHPMGVNLCF